MVKDLLSMGGIISVNFWKKDRCFSFGRIFLELNRGYHLKSIHMKISAEYHY